MNALIEHKLAIIGRGLAGLTLAFRMAQQGLRPLVFGASSGPANASRCAQGIVCNKGLLFADSPLFRAKLQTLRNLEPWLQSIEDSSGMKIPRSWRGVDEPYWNEEDFHKTLQRVYRGNFWGCYRPSNQPARLWALRDFRIPSGFMHYPDDAWFDVQATMIALEQACQKLGVRFLESAVEALMNAKDCIQLKLNQQTFALDHVVIAAGAESLRILQGLGLECPKFFHIAGQSLSWDAQGEESARILVKGNLSLALLSDRRILGSSSWKPEPGQEPDLIKDRDDLLHQAEAAFGLPLPEPRAAIRSAWGVRLRFVDRMPALGIWPEESLQQRISVLTGFYKNGLQLADLCAEQLLLELTGHEMNEFGQAFHVGRFFRSQRRDPGSPPDHCPLKKRIPH
jgi:glycine/D-amino acid oxidase-like deaminating enzyme